MSQQVALTPLDPADYHAIEAAVLETARGRWFLAEYAKRNRNSDTNSLLSAIGRLEDILTGERAAQETERVRFDLAEMAKVLARAKADVAAIRPDGSAHLPPEAPGGAFENVLRTAERATADILESAEAIQEAAWTLREQGADTDQCGILDHRATQIYTASTFQDLTVQRVRKIVQTLNHLEGRLNAMVDQWSAEPSPTSSRASTETPSPPQADETDVPFAGGAPVAEFDPLDSPVDVSSIEVIDLAKAEMAGAAFETQDEAEGIAALDTPPPAHDFTTSLDPEESLPEPAPEAFQDTLAVIEDAREVSRQVGALIDAHEDLDPQADIAAQETFDAQPWIALATHPAASDPAASDGVGEIETTVVVIDDMAPEAEPAETAPARQALLVALALTDRGVDSIAAMPIASTDDDVMFAEPSSDQSEAAQAPDAAEGAAAQAPDAPEQVAFDDPQALVSGTGERTGSPPVLPRVVLPDAMEAAPAKPQPDADPFAAIDRLDVAEKLRRFT